MEYIDIGGERRIKCIRFADNMALLAEDGKDTEEHTDGVKWDVRIMGWDPLKDYLEANNS